MIIFLYGSDSYRRSQKLKEYIERYKAKYEAFSLSNFDFGQEEDWAKFKDFSRSKSLFESSKLGMLFNIGDAESKKEMIEILKENLESKDLTLIISEDKKPTKDFNFLLKKPVVVWEFENLTGAELENFLEKESEARKLSLDRESQNLLAQIYGNDSWGLITELDKLSLLDEKKITKAILENHLNASLPINIFYLIPQMRNSENIGQRLAILEKLLESGDPAMIFNILAVSPYADADWKKRIADYDASIKSGKLEYEEVLLELSL
ncbi:MAG: hypothetical protein Q7S73_01315 [bacterium]|nr:hypothetical protein [bacterium]